MSSQKERRQKQLAVVGAIGHEHFMTGVRMLYACRYQDALAHFQEAAILEPHSRGYLSYLGLATAHAIASSPTPSSCAAAPSKRSTTAPSTTSTLPRYSRWRAGNRKPSSPTTNPCRGIQATNRPWTPCGSWA